MSQVKHQTFIKKLINKQLVELHYIGRELFDEIDNRYRSPHEQIVRREALR
jgi:hypothetical protein